MENASKALIIAGAILVSILIISFGVIIINKAKGPLEDDTIGQMSIDTFNSRFTSYEGTKVSGAQVKNLVDAIEANNTKTDDESLKISIESKSIKKPEDKKSYGAGTLYIVDFEKSSAGRINKVIIEENK